MRDEGSVGMGVLDLGVGDSGKSGVSDDGMGVMIPVDLNRVVAKGEAA